MSRQKSTASREVTRPHEACMTSKGGVGLQKFATDWLRNAKPKPPPLGRSQAFVVDDAREICDVGLSLLVARLFVTSAKSGELDARRERP